MKRIFHMFLAALLCLTACGALLSCKGPADSDSGKEQSVLITGFESYDELVAMRKLNYFGAIRQYHRDDIAYEPYWSYITEGETAIFVEAKGQYTASGNPTLVLDTSISTIKLDQKGSYEKYDFSDVSKILLDVYNDNETEENVYFQYQTQSKDGINKLTSPIQATIPAKTFKTCEFVIDRNFISQLLNIDLVTQLRISFDNETEYMQPPRRFFVDNLRYVATDEPIDQSQKARREGELESADRAEFLSVWSNFASEAFFPSTLTFNSDARYIKEGTGSFCMKNSPMTRPEPTAAMGWVLKPHISDISSYDYLSMWFLNTSPEDLWLRWYVKASEDKMNCTEHALNDGKCPTFPPDGLIYVDAHYNSANRFAYIPAAKNGTATWFNVRIPVSEIAGWGVDITNFDFWGITFHGVNNLQDVAVYLDEFHLVKES